MLVGRLFLTLTMSNPNLPEIAAAAFNRVLCLILLLSVQLITTSGIMPDIPDNHWRYVYLILVTMASAAAVLPLVSQSIIIDMIDISSYELLFYVYGFALYLLIPDQYNKYLPDWLWIFIPTCTFFFTIGRLISPPTLNHDRWPAIGLVGFWLKRDRRWHLSATTGVIIAILVASPIAASKVAMYPPGWSRYLLAIVALLTIALWGKPMLVAILGIIRAKFDADANVSLLTVQLTEQAAQLSQLQDSLALSARNLHVVDRESAAQLIETTLTAEDAQLLKLVSILRPDIKRDLIDYVLDISDANATQRIRRVK